MPQMIPVEKLIELSRINRAPYDSLKKGIVLKYLSKEPRDINVIIGIRGRKDFLPVCIKYFKKAIEKSDLKVNITIVEQDNAQQYKDICKNLNVDYIFIPNSILKNGNSYNRSFCFNAGYLLANPSTWYLFHDIDILVDSSFFIKVNTYLKQKNLKWLQPYTKKRVLLLSPRITEYIIINGGLRDDLSAAKCCYREAQTGSTGGSILVRDDIFMEAGGFDPEFFYGYGPEDSFFWSKLEVCNNPVGVMGSHFYGGGTFADDPPIEVYHMYHEPMWYTNPDEKHMLYIRESFWKYSYEDKIKLIAEKKNTLKGS
jgi:predicted glycosyltransferase involved in capsule biosynthesis